MEILFSSSCTITISTVVLVQAKVVPKLSLANLKSHSCIWAALVKMVHVPLHASCHYFVFLYIKKRQKKKIKNLIVANSLTANQSNYQITMEVHT